MFGLSFLLLKCIINAVYFYSFSEIMQAQGKFQHYSALFDDKRIYEDEFETCNFKLMIKLAKLYKRTNLKLLIKLINKEYLRKK